MLDLSTRWHAANLIPNKEEHMLMTTVDVFWASSHGAQKKTDGESGIVASESTRQYLGRKLH
jgi:hypothetical protein